MWSEMSDLIPAGAAVARSRPSYILLNDRHQPTIKLNITTSIPVEANKVTIGGVDCPILSVTSISELVCLFDVTDDPKDLQIDVLNIDAEIKAIGVLPLLDPCPIGEAWSLVSNFEDISDVSAHLNIAEMTFFSEKNCRYETRIRDYSDIFQSGERDGSQGVKALIDEDISTVWVGKEEIGNELGTIEAGLAWPEKSIKEVRCAIVTTEADPANFSLFVYPNYPAKCDKESDVGGGGASSIAGATDTDKAKDSSPPAPPVGPQTVASKNDKKCWTWDETDNQSQFRIFHKFSLVNPIILTTYDRTVNVKYIQKCLEIDKCIGIIINKTSVSLVTSDDTPIKFKYSGDSTKFLLREGKMPKLKMDECESEEGFSSFKQSFWFQDETAVSRPTFSRGKCWDELADVQLGYKYIGDGENLNIETAKLTCEVMGNECSGFECESMDNDPSSMSENCLCVAGATKTMHDKDSRRHLKSYQKNKCEKCVDSPYLDLSNESLPEGGILEIELNIPNIISIEADNPFRNHVVGYNNETKTFSLFNTLSENNKSFRRFLSNFIKQPPLNKDKDIERFFSLEAAWQKGWWLTKDAKNDLIIEKDNGKDVFTWEYDTRLLNETSAGILHLAANSSHIVFHNSETALAEMKNVTISLKNENITHSSLWYLRAATNFEHRERAEFSQKIQDKVEENGICYGKIESDICDRYGTIPGGWDVTPIDNPGGWDRAPINISMSNVDETLGECLVKKGLNNELKQTKDECEMKKVIFDEDKGYKSCDSNLLLNTECLHSRIAFQTDLVGLNGNVLLSLQVGATNLRSGYQMSIVDFNQTTYYPFSIAYPGERFQLQIIKSNFNLNFLLYNKKNCIFENGFMIIGEGKISETVILDTPKQCCNGCYNNRLCDIFMFNKKNKKCTFFEISSKLIIKEKSDTIIGLVSGSRIVWHDIESRMEDFLGGVAVSGMGSSGADNLLKARLCRKSPEWVVQAVNDTLLYDELSPQKQTKIKYNATTHVIETKNNETCVSSSNNMIKIGKNCSEWELKKNTNEKKCKNENYRVQVPISISMIDEFKVKLKVKCNSHFTDWFVGEGEGDILSTKKNITQIDCLEKCIEERQCAAVAYLDDEKICKLRKLRSQFRSFETSKYKTTNIFRIRQNDEKKG
eukprot:GHVL01028594.1.p1 GENE.GHVL01028594.1~~GHVL01028594.1.p1  ORF type:complete len:1149 (+),score=311.04 GHVL01028594.1:2489-5935(+)